MNRLALLLLFVAVVLPVMGFIVLRWWKLFNSPDGERYMKRRMQGPFVPLSKDEVADDNARAAPGDDLAEQLGAGRDCEQAIRRSDGGHE